MKSSTVHTHCTHARADRDYDITFSSKYVGVITVVVNYQGRQVLAERVILSALVVQQVTYAH